MDVIFVLWTFVIYSWICLLLYRSWMLFYDYRYMYSQSISDKAWRCFLDAYKDFETNDFWIKHKDTLGSLSLSLSLSLSQAPSAHIHKTNKKGDSKWFGTQLLSITSVVTIIFTIFCFIKPLEFLFLPFVL